MRALTVCQPYASLIIDGQKRVENRSWPVNTDVFCSLVIHAGASDKYLDTWPHKMPDPMPFGVLLGVVDLIAVLHIEKILAGDVPDHLRWVIDHEHTEGPWCWVLASPRAFDEPRKWRGMPGIFHVPNGVCRQLLGLEQRTG